jgi:hypothetical protein
MAACEKLAVKLERVHRAVGPVGEDAQRAVKKLEPEKGGFDGGHL